MTLLLSSSSSSSGSGSSKDSQSPEFRHGESEIRGMNARKKIRIMIVDDHKIVREGLAGLLCLERDFELVGEASNGRMAVDLARELRPDVIIMDISMPVMNGIEATRVIAAAQPGVRIIGLSMHDKEDMAGAMRDAGASGYVSKDGPSSELISAIRGES